MLNAQQAGRPYVKAHHRAALQEKTGRSAASFEFKYRNIPAVLEELGMDQLRGYIPADNYQAAIFPAIDRYLSSNPATLTAMPVPTFGVAETTSLFVEPPPALGEPRIRPAGLERLVRKFDPSERDANNRTLGKAGEAIVFEFEQNRLRQAGRADLARKVRWVADADGDGAGYDVKSFDLHGNERLLEVKTTCGGARTPFFLSRNEESLSRERPAEFRIFRVYGFGKAPRSFKIKPPLDDKVNLETEIWRARFN